MTKTRTTMLTTAVVVIVAIVSSVVVGASSSLSSSGADRHQQRQRQQYDRSTKSTRMHERRRRAAAAIAVGDFFPPSMAPPTANTGAEEEEAGRRLGGVVRMSPREVQAVQAQWSAQPAGNSSNNDENKEKDAMLRRVIRDMNSNNDNDNTLDEKGRRERKLGWWNGGSHFGKHNADPYAIPTGLADAGGTYYDKWQQAYRFLGVYIDCTHTWGGQGHSHDDNKNNNGEEQEAGCSRWAMWAAYVDPNYAGGQYDEYFGDNAPGTLDCHSPDSTWILLGVYRQEFYQFIQQISKHLWSYNDNEYAIANYGLAYMTNEGCSYVGYDEYGTTLYSEVRPMEGGYYQMGLYSDAKCITLNTKTKYTYDDFATAYSDMEYTLTSLNSIYADYRYCTSCVDYPTYQDGYFIGDDGTDDGDLINQCWKFYSHDSYNCDGDCLSMGSVQNSMTWISYGGKQFGRLFDGQNSLGGSVVTSSASGSSSSGGGGGGTTIATSMLKSDRFKANLFLTACGIVLISTFLAFAVSRGSGRSSRRRKVRSSSSGGRSRSRRLLDVDGGATSPTLPSSRRPSSSRPSSRSSGLARLTSSTGGGDGRSVRTSSKRSSSDGKERSKREGGSSSSRKEGSSRRDAGSGSGAYIPPSTY